MQRLGFSLFRSSSISLIIFALSACGGGGGSEGGGSSGPVDEQNPPSIVEESPAPDEGASPDQPEDFADKVYSLAIQGAQGFAITGKRGEVETAAKPTIGPLTVKASVTVAPELTGLEPETLYRVNMDGQLERVKFLDEAGDELTRGTLKPLSLVEVGDDFVHLTVEAADHHSPIGLIVSKKTGRAFFDGDVFGDVGGFQYDGYQQALANHFQFDPSGNVYFLRLQSLGEDRAGYLLNKLDFSSVESGDLTAAPLQQNHTVEGFEISSDGEIIIYYGQDLDYNSQYMVYDAVSNRWQRLSTVPNLPNDAPEPGAILRGLDGNLYVTYNLYANDEPNSRFYRLSRENGVVVAADLGQLMGTSTSSNDGASTGYSDAVAGLVESTSTLSSLNYHEFQRGRMVVNGRLMYGSGYLGRQLLEVDLLNATVIEHDAVLEAFNVNRDVKLYPTERYLWIVGSSSSDGGSLIVRYDPTTQAIKQLPFDPNFELHNMEPLSSSHVMFEGIRLGDQRRIVGQMDVEGNLLQESIYDAEEVPVTVLRAILPADFIRLDGSAQDWDAAHRALNGEAGQQDGHDLTYYSSVYGRGYYYGLVEFGGTVAGDSSTRVVFDTHSLTVSGSGVTVTTGVGEPAEVSEGRSVVGEAVEFAVPASVFGTGATPVLEKVERFSVQPLLEDATYDWLNDVLTIQLILNAALTEQSTVTIGLSDAYEVAISGDQATIIAPDLSESSATMDSEVASDGTVAVTVEVSTADLGGSERSVADIAVTPELVEIIRDTLQ